MISAETDHTNDKLERPVIMKMNMETYIADRGIASA